MHPVTKKRKRNDSEDNKLREIFEKKATKDDDCVLCHDSILNKEVYDLPCGHIFHKECFKNQLKSNNKWSSKCSLCRIDLTDKIKNIDELNLLLKKNIDQKLGEDSDEEEDEEDEENEFPIEESDLGYLTAENEYWEYCENINNWFSENNGENNGENTIIEINDNSSSSDSLPDLTIDVITTIEDEDTQ